MPRNVEACNIMNRNQSSRALWASCPLHAAVFGGTTMTICSNEANDNGMAEKGGSSEEATGDGPVGGWVGGGVIKGGGHGRLEGFGDGP